MKKILLVLPIIAFTIFANAQNTYIGDQMPVKVMPNTLFFHGGDLTIKNTETTPSSLNQIVINDGNIKVNGDFKNNLANSDGKHFINTYTNPTSYGQLIIADSKDVSGKIAMERAKFKNDNSYSVLGFPFQGEKVKDIINKMTNSADSFAGYCAKNAVCVDRYKQTILVWDISETEYDAVTKEDLINPGRNYTIRLNDGSIRSFNDNITTGKFAIYGIPNNKVYSLNEKSGIRNATVAQFADYTWSLWKNKLNNYGETYDSYLGNSSNNDTNKIFGKNLHRFSNPFTSNLDLSDVSIANTWVKFNTNKAPTEVYDASLRFKVSRLPENYKITWTWSVGTNNASSPPKISAYLQKDPNSATTPYFWAGNPDALIIRPYEYFDIDYYTINSNNTSRIIDAKYNFGDHQKTFENTPKYNQENTGVFARNMNSNINNTSNLEQRGFIAPNDFTQVEFVLLQNNTIIDEAAYLVNGDFYTTGNATTAKSISNSIFLLEENSNGSVVNNSETLLNQFNSIDYVGKPLGLSFKNLTEGLEYKIGLRLFEYTILNQVDNFTNGRYYLLDKQNNQVTEVNANTQITFVADDNINTRFELYWNQEPRILATDDLIKTNKTFVYNNEKEKFVRFEKNNTTANIEIFDLTGRLITSDKNVSTVNDYKLKLTNLPNVYVVVITYEDGKVVSEKILNK